MLITEHVTVACIGGGGGGVMHLTYREIGGQKDYAVFGHCVIQCP